MSTKKIVHASLNYDFFRNKRCEAGKVLYLSGLNTKKSPATRRTLKYWSYCFLNVGVEHYRHDQHQNVFVFLLIHRDNESGAVGSGKFESDGFA